jgi:hypothetical protein
MAKSMASMTSWTARLEPNASGRLLTPRKPQPFSCAQIANGMSTCSG